MTQSDTDDRAVALAEVGAQLEQAASAKKCWRCGCLHSALADVEQAIPVAEQPMQLTNVLLIARERLVPAQYDCLGCAVCYPALASNALSQAGYEVTPDACAPGPVEQRQGWPPLPGNYTALRYRAPVAVCTLTNELLLSQLAHDPPAELAILGTLQTENLGIERLITNVLANPNIRFLVACGADLRQAVGHLPGQTLVALARAGIDERGRIIGAQGKRPVIRNLDRAAIAHFREAVEIIDLVGVTDPTTIRATVQECAARNPGAASAYAQVPALDPVAGYEPARLVQDPAGYVVVYVDRARGMLSLEHYQNTGVLDAIVEGRTAVAVYTPVIERGLISRLDHAAYLGRQLARAEQALATGEPFVQDAAPERQTSVSEASCACGDANCTDSTAAPMLVFDLSDTPASFR